MQEINVFFFFLDLRTSRKDKKGNKENYNLEDSVNDITYTKEEKDDKLDTLFDEFAEKNSLIIDTDTLAESIRLHKPNTEL